ncbi:MAG: ComEC/Rec2 family competence protein [Clostridiales bacterium]|nr:ComEC/Rec2 family competence protein [Clostridiales bacterium]
MPTRSPINFRAFLVVAVSIIGASLCIYSFMYNSALGIALGAVYLAGLFALAAVFTVKYIRKTTRLHKALAFILAAAMSLAAFTVGVVTYAGWTDGYKYQGYREVTGRVCYIDYRSGDYKIGLEKLSVDGEGAKGVLQLSVKPDGDVNIAEFVRCGDTLRFSAYITARKLFDNGRVDGTSFRTNIRYSASTTGRDVDIKFGEPNGLESMLSGMREKLVEGMGGEYGNIAYAMITGDKHGLYSGVTDRFSAAGLGHIMAVSGLHVGFIAAIFNLLLKRANRKIRFFVVSAVLILYTVIADFSPSVIRAVIMTEVYMLAQFVSGRRDILSSLCLSFSLILAVRPLYFFELGFQMSFAAIFGIAMFCNSISRTLCKIKIPKTKRTLPKIIGDGIASSVSVQAGIIPIEIYHFKNFQVFSLLVNIIFIPYVSVVFTATVLLLPISFIPGCAQVLMASNYLMVPIDFVSSGIASLSFSTVSVYASGAVFLCYPVMFVMSEFFMMDKFKQSVIIMSVIVYAVFCTLNYSPSKQTPTQKPPADIKNSFGIEYRIDDVRINRSLKTAQITNEANFSVGEESFFICK